MQYRHHHTPAQEQRRLKKFERRAQRERPQRVMVIAEIGSCHDGDLTKALQLVTAARVAGCDAVKAQFWSSADALADRRQVPERYREIYRRYQMPKDWLPELSTSCSRQGLIFGCSTYLPDDVPVVFPFVEFFKISSFEALDDALWLAHRRRFSQPILVSVGMCQADELAAIRRRTAEARVHGQIVCLLHCVSAYPAALEDLNLRVIRAQQLEGFSDHTGAEQTGAWAAIAGAGVIEVHLKLEATDPENPDAGAHALTPAQLVRYVDLIRQAERALGSNEKAQQECEQAIAPYRVASKR